MAKQTINIGTTANDGTGDPIRAAFGKVNDNFTEIYTANTGVNTGDQNLSAYATTAAVAAGYQPLDSDLTAISALTTTAYGRALLSTADAPTLRAAIGLGQTDAPTFLAQTLTGQSLTGTQATSLVDLSTTWLSTTGTPTAIKLNVIDTANVPAASNLMDLQVGGVSKLKVTKTGDTSLFFLRASSSIYAGVGVFAESYFTLGGYSQSTRLFQDDVGILAQRNGGASNAFRLYNGTDYNAAGNPTNFDRASLSFTSGNFRIAAENSNTTGYNTARGIDFATGGAVRMSIDANGFQLATFGNAAIGLGGAIIGPNGGYFNLNNYHGLQCASLGAGGGLDLGVKWSSATNPQSPHVLGITREVTTNALQVNNGTPGTLRDVRARSVIQQPPATITPANNGDLVVEATSNTLLTFKFKGSDGTVRSGTLVVA